MGRVRPSKKISTNSTFIRTGRPVSEKIVTCVVYKKPTGKTGAADIEALKVLANFR